jgi:putative sigma-54 modulation protein
MRVEILGRSKQPGINVVAAVRRSVGHALDRLAPLIRAVKLRIHDLNGPRGGVDQSCQITVTLTDGRQCVASSRAELQTEAIDRALARAARTIKANLERTRINPRQRREGRELRRFSLAAI